MKVLNIINSISGKKQDEIQERIDLLKRFNLKRDPEDISAIQLLQSEEARLNDVKAGTLAATMAIGLATQTGWSVLRYKLGGIQYETGDSNYAAQVQEKYSDTMAWVGYGGTVLGGTIAGASVAGPVGAVVGFVGSAIAGGINIGFKSAEERRKINYQIWEDTVKVDYAKARSDVNIYGGGRLR